MARHFTISELIRSTEALKQNIDNTPPPAVRVKLGSLISNLLDPIRERWGAPISVNSGFRSPVLNKAVGGVATSQHLKGEAADITAGDRAANKRLFELIVSMQSSGEISFDQLIWEKGDKSGPGWIHISYSTNNRNKILYL